MTPERKDVPLTDLIPVSWFKSKEGSSIWIRGYRCLNVPDDELKKGPQLFDLGPVRAIILAGRLRFWDTSQAQLTPVSGNKWHLDLSSFKERETVDGVYLLLIAPFDVEGTPGNEGVTRQRVHEAVGLLVAFNGLNMAFQYLYDNRLSLHDNMVGAYTDTVLNPMQFKAPDVSDAYINTLATAGQRIGGLAPEEKNRIRLSLTWFESATRQGDVDAFLSCWIALETLGMSDSNIRPVVEALARIYGIDRRQAQARFEIGRLFDVRGRIVHKGESVPISPQLQRYIEAVYVDLLFDKLGVPSERRAEAVLNTPGLSLRALTGRS